MKQQLPTSTETDYSFTSGTSKGAQPEPELVDLTALRTESQIDDQAATGTGQNRAIAEAVLDNSQWEYALLRDNGHIDDAQVILESANDAAAALQFINLFGESFAEFRRSAEFNRLQRGEQAKWRPTLRDANGRIVGELNYVLLNPTLPHLGQRPVVQIILPNQNYLAEVASRLKPDQQRAIENRQPISYLERRANPNADATVQTMMVLMTPASADQPERLERAIQEYRQVKANIKPESITELRIAFGQIAQQTLEIEGFRREALVDKLMEVNPLYRVTYHPDINALGRQPIHLQAVPLDYKGVRLQPPQIKNLLMGNSIEVVGIRDERRPGLYRADVRLNLLSNKLESSTQREEIKTDNKAEHAQHQQLVHRRGTDETPHPGRGWVAQRSAMPQQPEPKQRPGTRLGR